MATIPPIRKPWTKRHIDFIIQQLAEMWKPRDIARNMLTEFADEWEVDVDAIFATPTNSEARQRLKKLDKWLYDRARYHAYDMRSGRKQAHMEALRKDFFKNFVNRVPDANKEIRVRELSRIKEAAMEVGEYDVAVRALVAIKNELEGVTLRWNGKPIEHLHKHLVLNEQEARKQLQQKLVEAEFTVEEAERFVETIAGHLGNGQRSNGSH